MNARVESDDDVVLAMIRENQVNQAVGEWLAAQGATSVVCLRDRQPGIDVEALLHGKRVLVESKGEIGNAPEKKPFNPSQIPDHMSRQVYKVLELRQNHPDAIIYIANPMNRKIYAAYNKVNLMLTKLDIGALWIRPDLSVALDFEDIAAETNQKRPSSSSTVSGKQQIPFAPADYGYGDPLDKLSNSACRLSGRVFGVVLAVLFPKARITKAMVQNCSKVVGSSSEATAVHKLLTGQGGSKKMADWVAKHDGKENVLADGYRIVESNPELAETIKNEIERQLRGAFC